MAREAVYLSCEGPVAQLVLNQPARRNALTEAMWRAVPTLLDEAAQNNAIKVLIVRGAGGTFAAGADISEFETVYATADRATGYSQAIARALDGLAAFPKPTLALVEGACIGGGCAIALACDLRFAAKGSKFGITPAKLGLLYPLNDTKRLIDAVGVAAAKDLLFAARHVEAEDALGMGLIDRLLDADALDDAAQTFIAQLVANSASSNRLMKQIIARIQAGQSSEDEQSRQMFLEAFQSEDFQEGYRAFLEKRKPDFSG